MVNERRARSIMETEGLDALVLTSPENVLYFSGFRSLNQRLFRNYPTFVLYPLDKAVQPALIAGVSEQDIVSLEAPRVRDIRYHGRFYVEYHGKRLRRLERRMRKVMDSRVYEDPLSALCDVIIERGLERKVIGVDEACIPTPLFDTLKHRLPGARIVAASRLVQKIRAVKTDEEINRLRRAAWITERGIQEAMGSVESSSSVAEVAKILESTIRRYGGVPVATIIGAGETSSLPNAPPMKRRLAKGDIIRFDIVATYKDYYSDLGRTAIIGRPTNEVARTYKALRRALEKEIAIVSAGVRVSRLFEVAVEEARAQGLTHYRRHHCGHGIGLEVYEPPIITSESDMVLEEGMVINVETPYYELGFGGFIVEETLVVREDGFEMLSKGPSELAIL